jgi:hypothetical protein
MKYKLVGDLGGGGLEKVKWGRNWNKPTQKYKFFPPSNRGSFVQRYSTYFAYMKESDQPL